MPRLKRVLPSYRKHKASGQAVVSMGGIDRYLGPHGSTASLAEYDRLITEFLAAGRNVAVVTRVKRNRAIHAGVA